MGKTFSGRKEEFRVLREREREQPKKVVCVCVCLERCHRYVGNGSAATSVGWWWRRAPSSAIPVGWRKLTQGETYINTVGFDSHVAWSVMSNGGGGGGSFSTVRHGKRPAATDMGSWQSRAPVVLFIIDTTTEERERGLGNKVRESLWQRPSCTADQIECSPLHSYLYDVTKN